LSQINKRTEAVTKALKEISKLIEEMDKLNIIKDFLLQTDPNFIIDAAKEGKSISKYTTDIYGVLIKLYDSGYNNAYEDLEN
jgi:hypothetical protein